MAGKVGNDSKSFWRNPVSKDKIFFVDSADSEEFDLFCWAMERAFIVGLDSEWKPAFLSNWSKTPRVSILQIACRIYDNDEEHPSNYSERSKGVGVRITENEDNGTEGSNEGFDISENDIRDMSNFDISDVNFSSKEFKWRRKLFGEVGSVEGHRVQELIFLLDLLVLPLSSLRTTLKSVFVSRDILKLGFKFKQDLLYLAGSFPEQETGSCFNQVDPYIDIGKAYFYLQNRDLSLSSNGRKMTSQQSKSLSSICEEVLGIQLSKDFQCSDWEQRPLTHEQETYAAADAYCLLTIFDVVHQKFLDLHHDGRAGNEITNPNFSSAIIGLKELLLSPEYDANQNVLRTKFGLAVDIVTETIKGSLSLTSVSAANCRRKVIPFYLPILEIAQILGERILLSECESKAKLSRRKGRSRRSRISDNGKAEILEKYSEWQGPPPWNPSLGGDGIPRFLCDVMVEGLAKQLRCVGIDAATPSVKRIDPSKLVEQAYAEKRVLLTRDTKLLRHHLMAHNLAYRVKNLAKQEQLVEVIEMFNLRISEHQLMSRCIKCNGEFIQKSLTTDEAIASATSEQVIPEFLKDLELEFWQCSDCQQIYWEGTQYHNAIQQFSSICKVYD